MAEPEKRLSRGWLATLESETAAWRAEGIINDEQAGKIIGRYSDIQRSRENEQNSRLTGVIAILGAVLLGVGVILFFASNWQAISKTLKTVLVLSSIIVTYSGGYQLAYGRGTYPKLGKALIFLGSLFYGAGIWLIAQIFHINAHYPNGILFWAIGIVPVALVTDSLPVLAEASMLLTLWTVFEHAVFRQVNYLYLPLAAAILVLSYRMRSRLIVGLTLAGLVVWSVGAGMITFLPNPLLLLLIAMFGLFIFALGSFNAGDFAAMKGPHRIVGLLAFFLSLYVLTFRVLFRFGQARVPVDPKLVILLAAVFLCTATVEVFLVRKEKNRKNSAEAVSVLAVAALLFCLLFMKGAALIIGINIVFFLAVVAFVITGYLGAEAAVINLGLVFFVLDVIARYFDFFWDMLNKSVFFMVGGILLLAGGFLLERNRRKIIGEMRGKGHEA